MSLSLPCLEESLQVPAPRGVLQFPYCLDLYLPYPLPGHVELLSEFFERPGRIFPYPEPPAQYLRLFWTEGIKQLFHLLSEIVIHRSFKRGRCRLVFDEIAEM